ncbi:MAG: iron-sulfur cluster assembly accessory protein [Synechococcaceae cyanobacterium SM2_3_1]|nr:iron-sulfur cluster assembly accessory protein [Synechococcaceae cyanobacterium SM2_3_1]
MTITLTELAELRLRTVIRSSTKTGVRISVIDGGCSGYQYSLQLVDACKPEDLTQEQGSLQLFIDSKSFPLLEGIVVDYVEGLTQSGFKFHNPNATNTCGCGQSFQAGGCTPIGAPCS